jgi:hypothetical protein
MPISARHDRTSAWVAVLVACAGAGVAAPAGAQPSSQSAAAQALFDEAKALMKTGQYAPACAKLEESQRLDPGSGTLINLADCYEQSGRLASAWSAFLDAAAAARAGGNAPREQVARERAAALEPRLPRIVIAVPASPPAGLEIRRDDLVVGAPQWGLPIPLDPGEHAISAAAPGRKLWSTRVVVREGSAPLAIAIPELALDTAVASEAPASAAPASRETSSGLGAQRTVALVAGGVGVVGLVVGSVFGLKSRSEGSDAERDGCNDDRQCTDPRGFEAAEDAVAAGNVSTVAFIVGGVGLAAASVLWFTASPSEPGASQTALGFGLSEVKLRTTW